MQIPGAYHRSIQNRPLHISNICKVEAIITQTGRQPCCIYEITTWSTIRFDTWIISVLPLSPVLRSVVVLFSIAYSAKHLEIGKKNNLPGIIYTRQKQVLNLFLTYILGGFELVIRHYAQHTTLGRFVLDPQHCGGGFATIGKRSVNRLEQVPPNQYHTSTTSNLSRQSLEIVDKAPFPNDGMIPVDGVVKTFEMNIELVGLRCENGHPRINKSSK